MLLGEDETCSPPTLDFCFRSSQEKMPAQSGIEPSSETIQRWQEQLNDPQLRLVKVRISPLASVITSTPDGEKG